ncbi:MAG: 4Fe-4S binding protein [Bacteroidales bacterium]|jgi:NAD-dependent dihydropyrimidine dehydrogenase PreA subunit|nr:4Fe-4S binding protein [Bacteroidales bacterium]
MKREIIKIDEEKCNGCGLCIPSCPEGALQIIDGKARLVSDLMCDGLGVCIGECPEGAIEIEEREAEPYNEAAVIREIVKFGENTIVAHLKHLLDHNEMKYFEIAVEHLEENSRDYTFNVEEVLDKVYAKSMGGDCAHGGCPGAKSFAFEIDLDKVEDAGKASPKGAGVPGDSSPSELRQWPVQMHLINPAAPYFLDAEVVLAADCVAFSVGNFHQKYLRGRSLAIACPKLDQGKEVYVEKLTIMIDKAQIRELNVLVMEVPCCSGLVHIATLAREAASRKVPVKKTIIGIKGDVLQESYI